LWLKSIRKTSRVENYDKKNFKNRYKHLNQRNQPYFAGKIEDIGMQIAALNDEYRFIIVSSGAIAAETVCKTGK
jgi:glutamate 5-kinase